MNKKLVASLVVGVVSVLGLAAASPYYAMHQMRTAAQEGDADTLNEYVDYPAVRESLKGQIAAKAAVDVAESDNPYAAAGNAFALTFINGIIDALVTPEAISNLIIKGNAEKAKAASVTESSSTGDEKNDDVAMGYSSFSTFDVSTTNVENPAQVATFRFNRDGLFGWKLVSMKLPM